MSKYQKAWETKPMLKEWIEGVPNDSTKAYCRVCHIQLYAHRYSVLKHTSTKKHQDNYEKQLKSSTIPSVNPSASKTTLEEEPVLQQKEQQLQLQQHLLLDAQEKQGQVLEDNEDEIIADDALIYNESVDVVCIATEASQTDFDEEHRIVSTPAANHFAMANSWERVRLRIETNDPSMLPVSAAASTAASVGEKRTISSHILDTSRGRAVSNVVVTAYRLENDEWLRLNQVTTNEDGRATQLVNATDYRSGIYKLHFNVHPYFEAQRIKSFYPFIEIVVDCMQEEHYHIPLLLNPYGYSTYRGT